jgi:nicotinate-nucleotide adenylyltransferase
VAVRVAVFGGSFNPPHVAHVLACALVLSVEDIDRVLVVPTYRHPFAKPLAPFGDRLRMCELAMGWMPAVDVSGVEAELGGESRTLHTLERLIETHSDWRLRLLIGADIVAEAPRWFGFDAIAKLAPPIVLARARTDNASSRPLLLPDVSSTQVRAWIAAGAWDELANVVPRRVLEHVRAEGLYGAAR